MAEPKDKELYNRIKKDIFTKNPKNSAYRSALLVKTYKEAYKKKYGNSDAYEGKKNEKKGIARWMKEEWRTQDGKKVYEKKTDIFRPTKRITKETPTTIKELSKKQIEKSQEIKGKTGRVKNYAKL